jgi:hypothetical protein
MTYEIPRDIALEDNNLSFIVLLKLVHNVGHPILGVLVPKVES